MHLTSERYSNGRVQEVIQIQPMPAGCFEVITMDEEDNIAKSITSIYAVLFIGYFKVLNVTDPVECYGIEDPGTADIVWKPSEEVGIHMYGTYKSTCEMIGETPMPFVRWYQWQQVGYTEFDIPLMEPEAFKKKVENEF